MSTITVKEMKVKELVDEAVRLANSNRKLFFSDATITNEDFNDKCYNMNYCNKALEESHSDETIRKVISSLRSRGVKDAKILHYVEHRLSVHHGNIYSLTELASKFFIKEETKPVEVINPPVVVEEKKSKSYKKDDVFKPLTDIIKNTIPEGMDVSKLSEEVMDALNVNLDPSTKDMIKSFVDNLFKGNSKDLMGDLSKIMVNETIQHLKKTSNSDDVEIVVVDKAETEAPVEKAGAEVIIDVEPVEVTNPPVVVEEKKPVDKKQKTETNVDDNKNQKPKKHKNEPKPKQVNNQQAAAKNNLGFDPNKFVDNNRTMGTMKNVFMIPHYINPELANKSNKEKKNILKTKIRFIPNKHKGISRNVLDALLSLLSSQELNNLCMKYYVTNPILEEIEFNKCEVHDDNFDFKFKIQINTMQSLYIVFSAKLINAGYSSVYPMQVELK